jgi:hypothetical protein
LGAELAQVEDGGQDPVGIGEPEARACPGRAAALGSAPVSPGLLALRFLRRGQVGGQVVQAVARFELA